MQRTHEDGIEDGIEDGTSGIRSMGLSECVSGCHLLSNCFSFSFLAFHFYLVVIHLIPPHVISSSPIPFTSPSSLSSLPHHRLLQLLRRRRKLLLHLPLLLHDRDVIGPQDAIVAPKSRQLIRADDRESDRALDLSRGGDRSGYLGLSGRVEEGAVGHIVGEDSLFVRFGCHDDGGTRLEFFVAGIGLGGRLGAWFGGSCGWRLY